MNCTNCGKTLPNDSEFCTFCGKEIEKGLTPKCSKCGSEIPKDSEFCPYCGVQYKQEYGKANMPKGTVSPAPTKTKQKKRAVHTERKKPRKKQLLWIIVGVICILLLLGMNVYQMSVNRGLDQELQKKTDQLKSYKNSSRYWEDTAHEYEAKVENIDEIYNFLSINSPSYASYLFNASDSVVVMDKNSGKRAVTITTAFDAHVSYSISSKGLAASADFAENTWYGKTTHINITPNFEGTSVVTITNDYTNQSIKILVVVTD